MITNHKCKDFLQQKGGSLKKFLSFFLPQSRTETVLLIVFFLFYSTYSLVVVFKTSLIDSSLGADLYFSFDNPQYYNDGYSYVQAHPLTRRFMYPLFFLGNLLASVFHYKTKTLLYYAFFGTLMSLSVTYVFRYFLQIVEISKKQALILTAFYGVMSTNMVLAFTPESFSLSAFALVASLLYYSFAMKDERRVSFLGNSFFAVLLGGITFTNLSKGLIPMFFTKEKLRVTLLRQAILVVFFIVLLLSKPHFLDLVAASVTTYGYTPEQQYFDSSFLSNILNFFLGSIILFPAIYVKQDLAFNEMIDMISLGYYSSFWQYIFIVLVYGLVIYSIVKGFKNKYVLLITLLFASDVFLHIVLKYGYQDYFIYAGHWAYCIPLLIGWLYRFINEKQGHILTGVLSVLLVVLLVNNIYAIVDFLHLAIEYYPAY